MTTGETVQDSVRRAHGRSEWRPAAVLKELLEHAARAGARWITVEIGQAGRERICVHDGGAGISRVELACMRHAASKLTYAVDLDVDGIMPLETTSAWTACMRHATSKLTSAADLQVDGSTPLEATSEWMACMRRGTSTPSCAADLDVDGRMPLEAISAWHGRRDEARLQTAEAGL